jgi:hypothetical protein
MATLEPHDELGLAWDDWADGRAHMLKRGVDFFRGPGAVLEAAQNAARRLDKSVTVVKEVRLGETFMWVQFVEYQIEWGQPCPCGSTELRQLNRAQAECAVCKATLNLVRPREKGGADDAAGEDPAAALLQPLFRHTAAGGKGRGAAGITSDQMREIWNRAKEAPPPEAKLWSRRSYNDYAAIILTGPFSPDGQPVTGVGLDEEFQISTLFEFSAKQLDVRCGIVLTNAAGVPRYRFVHLEPARISRPGRYTFTVRIPAGMVEAGEYTARTSAALVRGDDLGRVARRTAFSLTVGDPEQQPAPAGENGDGSPPETIQPPDLDWVIEPGEGPWRSTSEAADTSGE